MKTAVILFNLGGPDSKKSIRPFLFRFFMDPNIVYLPKFFRFLLASYISIKRTLKEAGKSYSLLGDKSPLLENSYAQARALENILGPDFKVFVCMRYWHPMADEIVRHVNDWGADKIVLLPLYPQFSTTTTWSSLGEWQRASQKAGLNKPISMACCYPFNEGFITASVDNIKSVYTPGSRILFSAHGLPEVIIKNGDPYQWQCEESARRIAQALNIPNLDWAVCYQSRVGAQKWIGPSTEDELRRAAKDKVPVVIYPHAFTQEHVETLVEIEIEYGEMAHEMGVPAFARVPCVSTHPDFIEGLAQIVKEKIHCNDIAPYGSKRLCPQNFKRCVCAS